jgi:hypothetical protein
MIYSSSVMGWTQRNGIETFQIYGFFGKFSDRETVSSIGETGAIGVRISVAAYPALGPAV